MKRIEITMPFDFDDNFDFVEDIDIVYNICRKIEEAYGEDIYVESLPGGEFYTFLKRADDNSQISDKKIEFSFKTLEEFCDKLTKECCWLLPELFIMQYKLSKDKPTAYKVTTKE